MHLLTMCRPLWLCTFISIILPFLNQPKTKSSLSYTPTQQQKGPATVAAATTTLIIYLQPTRSLSDSSIQGQTPQRDRFVHRPTPTPPLSSYSPPYHGMCLQLLSWRTGGCWHGTARRRRPEWPGRWGQRSSSWWPTTKETCKILWLRWFRISMSIVESLTWRKAVSAAA